jgi:hypothetical protein
MQLLRERIRWMLDQEAESGTVDAITGSVARAARGNDMQFELGLSVTIDEVNTLLDPSPYQTLTLIVKELTDRGGNNYIEKTIGADAFNLVLTRENWDNGTDQHAIIIVPAAETKLPMGNQIEKSFYWSVRAHTNVGTDVTLGEGELILYHDGVAGENSTTPALGSTLVPIGTLYGGGTYVLNGLIAGYTYSWEKGANDTDLVNGGETLTATGWFKAQGASVTMHGTAGELITALVRWPRLPTWEDLQANSAGNLKIVNAPGVQACFISPNRKWMCPFGVDDNGLPVMGPSIQLGP